MKKTIFYSFILLLISIVVTIFYAFYIEPKRITVHSYELGKKAQTPPIKLIQLSDIHLQEKYPVAHLKKIIEKVNQEKPDIVVFTGDLYDNFAKYGPIDEVIDALNNIKAPLGKYAVWGNHDYGGGAVRIYETVLQKSGFQLLENTGTTIDVNNDTSLYIAGIDDSLLREPSIPQALENRTKNMYTILLSHEPDLTDVAVNYDVSLILSGHSHGGQVKLPFFSVKNVLSEKYFDGFYDLDQQTTLYVNTGLGTTKIPVRLGVPPEIAVFKLSI